MIDETTTIYDLLGISYKSMCSFIDDLKKDGVTSDDIRRCIFILELVKGLEDEKYNKGLIGICDIKHTN